MTRYVLESLEEHCEFLRGRDGFRDPVDLENTREIAIEIVLSGEGESSHEHESNSRYDNDAQEKVDQTPKFSHANPVGERFASLPCPNKQPIEGSRQSRKDEEADEIDQDLEQNVLNIRHRMNALEGERRLNLLLLHYKHDRHERPNPQCGRVEGQNDLHFPCLYVDPVTSIANVPRTPLDDHRVENMEEICKHAFPQEFLWLYAEMLVSLRCAVVRASVVGALALGNRREVAVVYCRAALRELS
mmetsp:Transcript_16603/g.39843  ORF Transcript_16603/g.39843 Transcript_16603/m.39843 type:complete len:245 (+) Transcript_16603:1688-2422(+)